MNATPKPCSELRESYLVRQERTQEPCAFEHHSSECAECGRWLERHRQLVGVLGAVGRYPAPAELDSAVIDELIVGTARLVEGILELPRLAAPQELEGRIEREIAERSDLGRTLDGLHRHKAPSVLDRLVDEELRDPAAVTRRMAGSLPRQRGPRDLGERVAQSVASVQRRSFRRIPLVVGSMAAAVVIAFSVPKVMGAESKPEGQRFQMVSVDSLRGLDPLAQDLLSGLTGASSMDAEAGL